MKNRNQSEFDVIVLGGGASGIMAAIAAARQGAEVAIIEHLDRIGKKILVTGNGKCNYTNLRQDLTDYRGNDPAFVLPVFHQFNEQDALTFFEELGIFPKERNGYVYPNSGQAGAVLDVLQMELVRLHISVFCSHEVKEMKFSGSVYHLFMGNKILIGRSIVFATGLLAGKGVGCDGSANQYIEMFGHHFIDVVPALVQLQSNQSFFKRLAGIRAEIDLKLLINGKLAGSESGELQLTEYGISGIVVFQLSRYAAKACSLKKRVEAVIDFMPQMEAKACLQYFEKRFHQAGEKTVSQALIGLFHKKLIPVLLERSGMEADSKSSRMRSEMCEVLLKTVKEFTVDIAETKGFSNAQVCAGGVDTAEIDNHTLMSKCAPNLFFSGEVIDIDGKCGGYNLQWAWSSGYVAGIHAAEASRC